MIVERNGKTTTYKVEPKPERKPKKQKRKAAPVEDAEKNEDIEKEANNGFEK